MPKALITGITGQDGCYLAELLLRKGDATKARTKLGWEPKVSFKSLVRMMVDADVEAIRRDTDSSGLSMTYETNDSHM